ncbi:MAG: hypothetical protein ACJA01_003864 [Saprospiraceae bacterium]|jgi:hypothetical protein
MRGLKTYIILVISFMIIINEAIGQSASFGNTYIHHDGETVVFGLHDFDIGGTGTLPGIVGTQREESFGIFGFSDVSPGWKNASDDRHIDGYVQVFGDQPFVFPIGDNGNYRPIGIAGAAGTKAAYFREDPDAAMTDDLFGGTYPALPLGGPFSTDEKENSLFKVSQVEYWDIDGNQPTTITLTWDIFSDITDITDGDTDRLTIVAWDGEKWVSIPSMINVLYLNQNSSNPQFNAGISNRNQGSITTISSFSPDDYVAYAFGAIASGFIGDFVWEDLNRDGIQDPEEPGLQGVTIELYDDFTDQLLDVVTSNINGRYVFEGVPPGRYYMKMNPPSGFSATLSYKGVAANNSDILFTKETATFVLEANMIAFDLDGGFYKPASIGDYVWLDINRDGVQQSSELPLANMKVELFDPHGGLLASTITDKDGAYTFTNLPPGDYFISIVLPAEYDYAPYKATFDTTIDSDLDPMTGRTDLITLISNERKTDIDIGISQECEFVAAVTLTMPDCGMTNGGISVSVTGASGPYEFAWITGESGDVISGLDTGMYRLMVTDSKGCTRAFTEQIIYGNECQMVCAALETKVFLEGPFNTETGEMHTLLNDLGYLPGQNPTTFFGRRTEPGQPYSKVPFNYLGYEGVDWESMMVSENNKYLYEDMTDWVLVSLRVAADEEYETCTRAGMLMKDGTIDFLEEDCCLVDPALEYYVVIEHRNHLVVMSPTPLPVVNDSMKYDFTLNRSYKRLLGFTQKEIQPDINVMYAANGDQYLSGESPVDINVNDNSEWLKQNGQNSSYFFMDFDLNGDANVQDKSYFLKNNGVFTDVHKGY